MDELFGLKISEGGITNIFKSLAGKMATACEAITAQLHTASIVASDETTTRVSGITQWQWSFSSDKAVLHKIAPSRAKSVPQEVMAGHYPDVWVSDRYAGQQELAKDHQVCLAHVLRDVQYAIDSGDSVFAPKIRDHLRWCIRVGHRREDLKDSTLGSSRQRYVLRHRISQKILHYIANLGFASPQNQVDFGRSI
jgi:transposase